MTVLRLPADERRDQILEVSIGVFGRVGYHGASMNDVAEAIGVTKPVLYQHFDSKEALYTALIEEVGGRLIDAIRLATADAPDGRTKTERGFLAYFRWVSDRNDEFMLLFGGNGRHERKFADQLRQITDAAAEAIAPLIEVDLDPVHRRTIAHALVGLAEGASRSLVSRGEQFDPAVIAAEVSSLAWAGLRAVQPAG